MKGETKREEKREKKGNEREKKKEEKKREEEKKKKEEKKEEKKKKKEEKKRRKKKSAEDFDCIYNQKSIITAFKEAGFKTGYFSNQIPDKAFIDNFSLEADTVVRLYSNIKESHHPYDNDIIDIIGHYIDSSDEPMFLVFHSYGSHFEYSQRYPENEAFFKPFKAESVKIKNRPILVNAYDNTIHYTDKTINGIIKQLDRPDVCSSLLYLSDHGEDLMGDERNMFLHCSPVPTYRSEERRVGQEC